MRPLSPFLSLSSITPKGPPPSEVHLNRLIEDALLALLAQAPPQSQKPFRLITVKGRLVNSALLTLDDESQFRPQH
jgi:hypothetical protein